MATTASSCGYVDIQNVVASSAIDCELDLERLCDDLPGSQFDPDRFPGVVYRQVDPKAAILIYRTGKLVSTGSNSLEDAQYTLSSIVDRLSELGVIFQRQDPINIINIVTSGELCDQLNLNALAIGLGLENIEYEPEQFPGLIYKPKEVDVAILLFGSGKLVITGGQTTEQIDRGYEHVRDKIDSLGML